MKIIFLDIDGVMNSSESTREFHTYHIADKRAVAALNHILRANKDVKIVISSTWRELHTLDYIAGWLEGNGVCRGRVHGSTPKINAQHGPLYIAVDRGEEITAWITGNAKGMTSYVVLDDDAWKMADHQSRFIDTDCRVGLTMDDAQRAIEILNKPL